MIETVYFGTYTKRDSQGIYQATCDTETGTLSTPTLLAKTQYPTYLTLTPNQQLLTIKQLESEGGIASFTLKGDEISHVTSDGAPPCYLSFDAERQLAFAANYHKGEVTVYRIDSAGYLTLVDCVKHHGSGPHPNQQTAHAHFADLTPDNFLITCDLGIDQLITYDIDANHQLHKINTYHAQAGAGPRHLVFHPQLSIAYLLCELNSSIEVLSYKGHGEFEPIATLSTLPESYAGSNATAAIRITADGNFLYASNRGHDSIAAYKIMADGNLELIEITSSQGQIPRDFCLSSDQNLIIVGHQDSDNISIFKRSRNDGRLSLISKHTIVPECVCVLFKTIAK